MNQKFLAGLGNIYVNEAIFMSKINPKTKSYKIPNNKIITLISNIKKVLKKAIKEGGSSIKDFNNTKGKKEIFSSFLMSMVELAKIVLGKIVWEKLAE